MNRPTDSEDKPKGATHAAAGDTGSDDERLLDHHLEELLGALSAGSQLGLQAPPDASA